MANCLKILLVFLQCWGALNYALAVVKHMVMICIAWLYFPRGASGMFHSYQPPTSLSYHHLRYMYIIWVPARCAHFSDFFKNVNCSFEDFSTPFFFSLQGPGKWGCRIQKRILENDPQDCYLEIMAQFVFLTKFWWLSLLSVCWPPKWMVWWQTLGRE